MTGPRFIHPYDLQTILEKEPNRVTPVGLDGYKIDGEIVRPDARAPEGQGVVSIVGLKKGGDAAMAAASSHNGWATLPKTSRLRSVVCDEASSVPREVFDSFSADEQRRGKVTPVLVFSEPPASGTSVSAGSDAPLQFGTRFENIELAEKYAYERGYSEGHRRATLKAEAERNTGFGVKVAYMLVGAFGGAFWAAVIIRLPLP